MSAETKAAEGPSPFRTNLLITVMCLIWGSTWIVVKKGVEDLPPFTAATLRMGLAGIAMAGVAAALARRESGTKPPLWLSATMGIGNFAITYGIVYWASEILPSGVIALLWAVFPMMMAIAGHFYLDGEKLQPRQWLGFLMGFAGVFVLQGDLENFRSVADDPDATVFTGPMVALIVLLSPLAACVATAVIKKHGANVSSNLLNRDGLLISTIPLLALWLAFERDTSFEWTGFGIFSIGYLAIVGTVVTFGIYYYLLRYAPAYKLSLIAFITPAIAMLMGTIFGDETLSSQILGGAGCILVGVLLVVLKKR